MISSKTSKKKKKKRKEKEKKRKKGESLCKSTYNVLIDFSFARLSTDFDSDFAGGCYLWTTIN